MVDPGVLHRRLERLRDYQKLLGTLARLSLETIRSDPNLRASAERHLQLAAQCMIDIASHVVADLKLGVPEDYKGLFGLLAHAKILPDEFAGRLKGWAGFRNILVHDYLEIDLGRLHEILQRDLGDIDEFLQVFARFLS